MVQIDLAHMCKNSRIAFGLKSAFDSGSSKAPFILLLCNLLIYKRSYCQDDFLWSTSSDTRFKRIADQCSVYLTE